MFLGEHAFFNCVPADSGEWADFYWDGYVNSQKTHIEICRILPKDWQVYPSAGFDSAGVIITAYDNQD